QGHVAYPHQAANPVPALVRLCDGLIAAPLDAGNAVFQPSNLELTSLDVGNQVTNVIPAAASARFNVRFTSDWTGETLVTELRRRLDEVTLPTGVRYTLETTLSGEAFRTAPGALSEAVVAAVEAVTGRKPELSTSGGTSDARFIARYCPVIEFGGVGATMHKVDERQETADIEALAAIYKDILKRLL
ncbi:MAG: M20/M25/M40 family metallo-hydrolase, partial [Holosporales bacterium]